MNTYQKILILILIILSVYTINKNIPEHVILNFLQNNQANLHLFISKNYFLSMLIYSFLTIISIVSTMPLNVVFNISAGYFFGIIPGTAISIISSTLGCTLFFLILKFFFKNTSKYLKKIEQYPYLYKIQNDLKIHNTSYIILMYWLPAIPYVIINTFAALSYINTKNFIIATIIGLTPNNLINAIIGYKLGEKLENIKSFNELFTLDIIFLFSLLAVLAILGLIIQRFIYKKYKAPSLVNK